MPSNRIVVANSSELNETNLWDKLPEESSKAFEAFVIFRDLGFHRTVKEVSRQLNKAYQLLYRWHRDFGWTQRAQAWDEFHDQLGQRFLDWIRFVIGGSWQGHRFSFLSVA